MVPTARFELATSPLPRECSTPELRGHRGDGGVSRRRRPRGHGGTAAPGLYTASGWGRKGGSRRRCGWHGLGACQAVICAAGRLDRGQAIFTMAPMTTSDHALRASTRARAMTRSERLATALRENLKRRKAQARARSLAGKNAPRNAGAAAEPAATKAEEGSLPRGSRALRPPVQPQRPPAGGDSET